MMSTKSHSAPRLGKLLPVIVALFLCVSMLSACSTNPATGESQFAGLMSPEQEAKIGAEEHQKIIKEYGIYDNPNVQAYVSAIGHRVTQKTERPDVKYKFYVIDSPIVNAFALPGGYIYVSRGLLALANSEAELAGVLAHETGHITARHSAERYSHSVVTSVGANILSTVLNSSAASQAIGLGSNLYLSGYSRGQENEADALGLRYMSQGGYDPQALSYFLMSLNAEKELAEKIEGRKSGVSYFSTHPPTPERVQKTASGAQNYNVSGPVDGQQTYFNAIDNISYGDSEKQGFARGRSFYHPAMGFSFDAPAGYTLINQPAQVIAKSNQTGAIMLFDFASDNNIPNDPAAFMAQTWIKNEPLQGLSPITINGLPAATASIEGTVNNQRMNIRLIAIQWENGKYARFQIAMPQSLTTAAQEDLKTASYSFRRMSEREKQSIKPQRVKIISAQFGDTVRSLSQRMPFEDYKEERFRVLNGLHGREEVMAGRRYKIIVE